MKNFKYILLVVMTAAFFVDKARANDFDCRPYLLSKAVDRGESKRERLNFFLDLSFVGAFLNVRQDYIAKSYEKSLFDFINLAHYFVGKKTRETWEWDDGHPLPYGLSYLAYWSFPKFLERRKEAFQDYKSKFGKSILVKTFEGISGAPELKTTYLTDEQVFSAIYIAVHKMNYQMAEESFCQPNYKKIRRLNKYNAHRQFHFPNSDEVSKLIIKAVIEHIRVNGSKFDSLPEPIDVYYPENDEGEKKFTFPQQ